MIMAAIDAFETFPRHCRLVSFSLITSELQNLASTDNILWYGAKYTWIS